MNDETINEIKVMLDEGAFIPEKAHDSDAGFDLRSRESAKLTDYCNGGIVFDTGVHVEIPEGYVGYVQGRSGLNVNHDIICPTGVIDAGFTGSIRVKLYNLGDDVYIVHPGDKIAQLVIQPVVNKCSFTRVDGFNETDRGSNGFGSSGR